MASRFILAPGEKFIQCPYNTAHQVTNERLNRHLNKCRADYLKNLSEAERRRAMKVCRHNAQHHIPLPEVQLHENTCRSAHSVVSYLSYHNSEEGSKQYEARRRLDDNSRHRSPSPNRHRHRDSRKRHHDRSRNESSGRRREQSNYTTNEYNLPEENWEDESLGNAPGYDPSEKLNKEVIVYNPQGLTKSERKKHRNEIRIRASEKGGEGDSHANQQDLDFDIKPVIKNEPEQAMDGHRTNEGSSKSSNYPSTSSASSSYKNVNSNYSGNTSHKNDISSKIGAWYGKGTKRNHEDGYSDSDDFEGYDPYD